MKLKSFVPCLSTLTPAILGFSGMAGYAPRLLGLVVAISTATGMVHEAQAQSQPRAAQAAAPNKLEVSKIETKVRNKKTEGAFDVVKPASFQRVRVTIAGAVATPTVELTVQGSSTEKLVLERRPKAQNDANTVFESTELVSLPAGRYRLSGPFSARSVFVWSTDWITASTQVERVSPSDAKQFIAMQDFLRGLDPMAARARRYFAGDKPSKKPGTPVSDELYAAGVLPASLREANPDPAAKGIVFGAFFAGSIESVWFQMREVSKKQCEDSLSHLIGRSKKGGLAYNYIYVNDHDGYSNILPRVPEGGEKVAFLKRLCDQDANVVSLGLPLK